MSHSSDNAESIKQPSKRSLMAGGGVAVTAGLAAIAARVNAQTNANTVPLEQSALVTEPLAVTALEVVTAGDDVVQADVGFVGIINVRDYGAVGDGVTDDTLAFIGALEAAVGGVLYVPEGNYVLSQSLLITTPFDGAIKIIGDGRGLSRLTWTSSSAGIEIIYLSALNPPHIEGITLETRGTANGTALVFTGPFEELVSDLGPSIREVSIRGEDSSLNCWSVGIRLNNVWYAVISELSITGRLADNVSFVQTSGLVLDSCARLFLSRFNMSHMETAILQQGESYGSGFSIAEFDMTMVTNGIHLVAANGPSSGTNIGPGHISANERGIILDNRVQTSIHDLLIYKSDITGEVRQDFIGIQLIDCDDNRIHDNEIRDSAQTLGITIGMQINGDIQASRNHIHNNQVLLSANDENSKFGIIVSANAGNNHIHNNVCNNQAFGAVTVFEQALKTNVIKDNTPVVPLLLSENSATPSVGNFINAFWRTTNTQATTITDLMDGQAGQYVTILVNDALTRFQHNVERMVLQEGADFEPEVGAVITFYCDNNIIIEEELTIYSVIWREVSRRI